MGMYGQMPPPPVKRPLSWIAVGDCRSESHDALPDTRQTAEGMDARKNWKKLVKEVVKFCRGLVQMGDRIGVNCAADRNL